MTDRHHSSGRRPVLAPLLALLLILALPGCAVVGPDGRPVIARNTPRPLPLPRPRPQRPTADNGFRLTVAAGDTVYALARRHGVDTRALINENRLRAPFLLRPGQKLRLPRPVFYTVRKGDTGYSISRRMGVGLTSLMRLNRIRAPFRLAVGQKLELPTSSRQRGAKAASQRSRTVKPRRSTPNSRRSRPRPLAPVTGSGPFAFMWPVRGPIISAFGAKGGGLHNDGVNIRVADRSPVRSAEAGVVVYAGSDLKGFGNLLLLRHRGGWVTAYAHNNSLLVKRGERVKKGEIIARAGHSGGVSPPQLHFEIRKGTRAVDPIGRLPGR